MKRFIDLDKQIGLDDEWPREFAFYCTVVDRFETHSGSQTWSTWKEFAEEYEGEELERFKSLCPDWVFGE